MFENVSKLTWSSNPGDQIEQKQVGSPMAEHNREKRQEEGKKKREVIFIVIHCVCPGVWLETEGPISQCATLSQHYSSINATRERTAADSHTTHWDLFSKQTNSIDSGGSWSDKMCAC